LFGFGDEFLQAKKDIEIAKARNKKLLKPIKRGKKH